MDPKTIPGAQIAEAIPSAPPVRGEVRPAISRSSNPFEEEREILSHQMRNTRIDEQSTQPPREAANHPTLRAWLRQEPTLEQSDNRGGYPANHGLRIPQAQLSQDNQGESRGRMQDLAAPGALNTERMRRNRKPRGEPWAARRTRNYGLWEPEINPRPLVRGGGLDHVMRMVDHRRIRPSQVQKW